jgi:hypothetical protein
VGFVEEEIRNLNLPNSTADEFIILFDLDLYEPTLAAFNYLKPHLKKGDLLYFDEAFDKAERAIITEHILKIFNCSPIGHTPLAICLVIENQKINS